VYTLPVKLRGLSFPKARKDADGLTGYGPNFAEGFRQAAIYVAKILKREKPADLPVVQPTKFKLAVNLRTAKAFDLAIPKTLLVAAGEVIE
jgi:putative ABC transport system substrate-binding protein